MIVFSDGMEFDTSGEYRVEHRADGWYVVGQGMLAAVADEKEGEQLIEKLRPGRTFEEWRATKRLVRRNDQDLRHYPCAADTEECWVYAPGLVIECRPDGSFLLALPQEEEISEEIEPLERRLYEFGRSEGSI